MVRMGMRLITEAMMLVKIVMTMILIRFTVYSLKHSRLKKCCCFFICQKRRFFSFAKQSDFLTAMICQVDFLPKRCFSGARMQRKLAQAAWESARVEAMKYDVFFGKRKNETPEIHVFFYIKHVFHHLIMRWRFKERCGIPCWLRMELCGFVQRGPSCRLLHPHLE